MYIDLQGPDGVCCEFDGVDCNCHINPDIFNKFKFVEEEDYMLYDDHYDLKSNKNISIQVIESAGFEAYSISQYIPSKESIIFYAEEYNCLETAMKEALKKEIIS